MLEKITEVPEGIVAVRAVGRLTADDYARVVEPMLDEARTQDRRLRVLLQLGPEYEGFTAGAAWGKAETWARNPSLWRRIEGYALVSDIGWIGEFVHLASFMVSFPMRVFALDEFDDAVTWLAALPEGPGTTHHLVPETGVLVIEADAPLRVQDFDAIAATADAWLGTHEDLPGVVVHAREFPGWENIGSLLRHIRFVRDHLRRVRRVAVASDSPIADIGPRLAEHVVRAEVRGFGHDQLDDALAWAGGASDEDAAPEGTHAEPPAGARR